MGTPLSAIWARFGGWMIAIGLAITLLVSALTNDHSAARLEALGYVLVVASGLALAASRRAPVPALLATAICVAGYNVIGFAVPALAYLFAVYAAVRSGHRVVTLLTSVTMLISLPLITLVSPFEGTLQDALMQSRDVLPLAWLIAAAAAGEAVRQADRRADEAERTRDEMARLRANEERLHIARELHDSLTHQISIIKVQAEVAVHLARRRGEDIPEALLAIQEAGREANRELRATLETMHDGRNTPRHGLDHVADLVERARGAGLETTLTITGQPKAVSPAIDQAAYRIVQESLTNVARHSSAATASIQIDFRPDVLVIQVDDDGQVKPYSEPVNGFGLLGMRQRVAALGGSLRAEPRSEGGFSVHAEIPMDTQS